MAADQEQVDVDMAAADDDDGGSSSDSDIEMDAAAEQQIMSLEEQLAANPHDYDKHVAVRTQVVVTPPSHAPRVCQQSMCSPVSLQALNSSRSIAQRVVDCLCPTPLVLAVDQHLEELQAQDTPVRRQAAHAKVVPAE